MTVDVLCFFFSSRRRHTRWTGDWSSDVCSSDLGGVVPRTRLHAMWRLAQEHLQEAQGDATIVAIRDMGSAGIDIVTEIGRAACRGREENSGGGGTFKKKKERKMGARTRDTRVRA